MTRAKAQNNTCLILKRLRTGEYDILVTAFTIERGKIRAMAKNAGRPGSTRAPHLEPITVSTLQLVPGEDLDFISQAITNDPMTQVKADLETLAQAHCIAETVDALTEDHDPCPEMFELAITVINHLPGASPGDALLRFFEYHALRLNGTQPELHNCVECMEPIRPEQHRFTPQLGGILCGSCHPQQATVRNISLRAVKVLRLIQSGDLHRTRNLPVNPALAKELRDIMSSTVSYTAARDIRSNAFLDAIRRNRPTKNHNPHTVNQNTIAANGNTEGRSGKEK